MEATARHPAKKLLTPKELTVCKTIAEAGNDYSQRAAALILVNSGSTHAQAAQDSGLTLGQFKYWLTRFRKLRLACFPDNATAETAPAETKVEVNKAKPKPEKAKKKDKDKKKGKDKTKAKDKKKSKKDKKSKKKK